MQERFFRRDLPHWDLPGATYFVTTCLAGSIPAQGLLSIEKTRDGLKKLPRPKIVTPREWRSRCWKQVFVESEKWLDSAPAVHYLDDPKLAQEVQSALEHFAGERYDLIAWVIMPSHFHWVYRPREEWVRGLGADADRRSPRQRIQHSVNRHSAYACNVLLGRTGDFWQRESYDHCVRDEEELERIIAYVHRNPVVAGLVIRPELYQFSSAYVGRVS